MRQALWPDSSAAEVEGLLNGRPPDAHVLVAGRDGGGLCGFAELGSRRYAEGCLTSPVAYLEGIWVDPDVRRRGVALSLVRQAQVWAESSGFTELGSDCDVENDASRAFHVAAGFVEVERIVCFSLSLTPESD
jgi:aminoglycoside 6'-N-acetyltransferase I